MNFSLPKALSLILAAIILLVCIIYTQQGYNGFLQSIGYLSAGYLLGGWRK